MPLSSPALPRNRWPLLRSELLWAYRGKVGRQHCDHWFHLGHISAWLVLKGQIGLRKQTGTYKAGAGEWLIGLPGLRYQWASIDCEILSIGFLWEWIYGRELYPPDTTLTMGREESTTLSRLGKRLVSRSEHAFPGARSDLATRSGPFAAHLVLQAHFETWLVALAAALSRRGILPQVEALDPRLEQAVRVLDQPGPATPRPPELARRLGVSTVHLNRLFVRELGLTVSAYTDQRRQIRARALLLGTELSVKQVAFQLGFVSPQHFARWFHTKAGLTPTQWRQRDPSRL